MGAPSITIRIADRGTPRNGLDPSATGHMWVELNDGNGNVTSLGFAPVVRTMWGQGHVALDDNTTYLTYQYSKTIPISINQYDDMMDHYPTWSDYTYIGGARDCINFVWDLLEQGGLNPEGIDGHPWPINNGEILDKMFPTPQGSMSLPIDGEVPIWCLPAKGAFDKSPHIFSPLVLDLDGDGIEVTKLGYGADASSVHFDLNNDGFAERTGWVTGGDGLLAWDKNNNGIIDNQSELFGDTATHANGFANLATLDTNSDNKITSADANWSNLRVWIDADEDGVTDTGELHTLSSLGITQINLNSTQLNNIYINENLVSDTSTFVINGQTRTVSDIWFRRDGTSTRYLGDVELDEAVFFLPTLRGFGTLKDLHIAMSEDSDLLDLVSDFVTNWSTEKFGNKALLDAEIKEILLTWAGVTDVNPTSRGTFADAQELAFLEQYFGVPYDVNPSGGNQYNHLQTLFDYMVQNLGAHLILQSGLFSLYDNTPYYNYLSGDVSEGILSTDAILAISDEADASPDAEDYWVALVSTLVSIKNVADFTAGEISALNDAIQESLPASSWNSILVQARLSLTDTSFGTQFSDLLTGTYLNDTLNGGAGDDVYYFESGFGQDNVYDASGNDEILFGAGITLADLRFERTYINNMQNLMIHVGTGGDRVQLMYQLYDRINAGNSYDEIETIRFFDGSTFNLMGDLTFTGTSANDQVHGTNSSDTLMGLGGGDTLTALGGNDLLIGGAGNDTLYGGDGDDVYYFEPGFGQDKAQDTSGNDEILFGEGITFADLRFERTYPANMQNLVIHAKCEDTYKHMKTKA